MNYLRHPNGRGKLFDDAEANRGTYISRDSSAAGMAKLRDCRLKDGSIAQGECQIYGGIYRGSTIKGRTVCAGYPLAVNCDLDCSEVSGVPTIYNSGLFGTTEVCDSPLINGIVADNAIIYGSPSLLGTFKVTGRVHEGTWTRPPKHIKLPWCDLSECIDGKLLLDCRCRTIEYWLRHGPKLAKRWDWSHDMIDVTLETIRREFATTNPLPELIHETIMRV